MVHAIVLATLLVPAQAGGKVDIPKAEPTKPSVDLQEPEGGKLVFELARRADVVVENFLPGVADKLGLG